jgi:hypothetical protein
MYEDDVLVSFGFEILVHKYLKNIYIGVPESIPAFFSSVHTVVYPQHLIRSVLFFTLGGNKKNIALPNITNAWWRGNETE